MAVLKGRDANAVFSSSPYRDARRGLCGAVRAERVIGIRVRVLQRCALGAGQRLRGAGKRAVLTRGNPLDPTIVGLCPEGVEFVVAGLEEAGFRTDVLINFRTLMAQGLERSGNDDLLHDGKGIDHLSEEFFATVDPLIEEAFGLCAV